MKIFNKSELLGFQDFPLLIKTIEEGFSAYSQGKVFMPPVGHMHFKNPQGDLHIKCASIDEEPFYVVKIASVFPDNSKLGLPSLTGMMLLFSQKTGELEALFLDEGYLTHLRTAVAGAISAKYLAPKNPQAIGIIGSGKQAQLQLKILSQVTSCREVWIWSHREESIDRYLKDPSLKDFKMHKAANAEEVAQKCRLIVTTTPATSPLLFAKDIQKGTHITAVGADRPGKQELEASILGKADRVVADSRIQCFEYGETARAIQEGVLSKDKVDELGEVTSGKKKGRLNEDEITIADLTGLGMQDLMIAKTFYAHLTT